MYTPGPWNVEMVGNERARIWGPNTTLIAECWRPHGRYYPTQSNAKLIAIAPDLLEVLERLVQAVEHTPLGVRGIAAVVAAKEAIAKARWE